MTTLTLEFHSRRNSTESSTRVTISLGLSILIMIDYEHGFSRIVTLMIIYTHYKHSPDCSLLQNMILKSEKFSAASRPTTLVATRSALSISHRLTDKSSFFKINKGKTLKSIST